MIHHANHADDRDITVHIFSFDQFRVKRTRALANITKSVLHNQFLLTLCQCTAYLSCTENKRSARFTVALEFTRDTRVLSWQRLPYRRMLVCVCVCVFLCSLTNRTITKSGRQLLLFYIILSFQLFVCLFLVVATHLGSSLFILTVT